MKNNVSITQLFNSIVENAVFLVAAVVLFFKTTELLSLFAPAEIFGYTGLEFLYGATCALLVEGLLVVTKWSLDKSDNPMAWAYKVGLLVVTFLISASAQIADGVLIRDTLDQQPYVVQLLIQVGVPLVPSVILALAAGKTVFEKMPPAVLADMAKKQTMTNPKVYAAEAKMETIPTPGETSPEFFRHRNTLSAEEKTWLATATDGQIKAKFGGSARRARGWRKQARDGKL